MEVKNHAKLGSFDFFVVRRPSLPVSLFLDFNDTCINGNGSLANSFKNLLLNYDGFLDALYIASPVLYERTKDWLSGKVISEEAKLTKTLYKYFGRICSRGTPYGLFSGIALGSWTEHTHFVLSKSDDEIYAELDILLLNQFVEAALKCDELKEKSQFYINNSIYWVADNLRYVEYVTQNSARSYFLSSIEKTELLQSALLHAQNGCELSKIRKHLINRGITEIDARHFVDDLVNLQLLVSDLHPRITDYNGLAVLTDKLKRLNCATTLTSTLTDISALLESGRDLKETCAEVKKLVQAQLGNIRGENLVHVTLQQKYASASIEKSVKNVLESDLAQLLPLLGSKANPDLSSFKKEFYNKYGDAEVPLSIALDGELGIDYGSSSRSASVPILNNLNLTPIGKHNKQFTEWDQFLLEIYLRYVEQGGEEIILDKADLHSFHEIPAINPSFYAYGNLIQNEEQDFRFHLNFIGGSSATTMLARFSGSNIELHEQLQIVTAHESACFRDFILAEIIFLPESRTGNVLTHPPLYPFEIPYLTLSSLSTDNQLWIDDLMLSVGEDGKITLRSKRIGKPVIPRLSNAHDYGLDLPVYRFLCDIQSENNPVHFSWKWSILKERPVLPRVSYRHIILSRKTWTIGKDMLKNLEQFISKYQVHRYVQLIQGDNELLLDLDLPMARIILTEEIEKKGQVELKEFISMPSKCIIREKEDAYTNEIVIPFKSDTVFPSPVRATASASQVQRKFAFGDEWVFVLVYGGVAVLDQILIETLHPLCKDLLHENLIRKWFFIRYQDPLPHIRIRFRRGENSADSFTIVNRLKEVLAMHFEEKLIDKIVLDTYDRELERYGVENIELAETIFYHDSELVLNLLNLITHYKVDEDRWLIACKGVDAILTTFGLSLDVKTKLISSFADNLLKEYVDEKRIRIQLNEKFRILRPRITAILEKDDDQADGHIALLFLTHISTLDEILKNKKESFSYHQIGSFLHMFCNRLFLTESREQETVIYHFLYKYYKAKKAQQLSVKE